MQKWTCVGLGQGCDKPTGPAGVAADCPLQGPGAASTCSYPLLPPRGHSRHCRSQQRGLHFYSLPPTQGSTSLGQAPEPLAWPRGHQPPTPPSTMLSRRPMMQACPYPMLPRHSPGPPLSTLPSSMKLCSIPCFRTLLAKEPRAPKHGLWSGTTSRCLLAGEGPRARLGQWAARGSRRCLCWPHPFSWVPSMALHGEPLADTAPCLQPHEVATILNPTFHMETG